MMAIMCVLHTWLAEFPASQRCLAASVLLRKTPADQTVDHIDHIEVACEYQISGRRLPSVAIRVTPVPATVWETNWVVQAMLVKLAEMDCHHPAAKLVNCFTARIGHAGPILDDINDQQLVSQLKAKPLLVLGPFELPAQLAAAADADEQHIMLNHNLNLAHAMGSLDIVNATTIGCDSKQFQWLEDPHVTCRRAAAELMINMCISRYSQYKAQAVLGKFCIAVANQSVCMPVLSMHQLVWLTKQSMMPGRLIAYGSICSIKSCVVAALRAQAVSAEPADRQRQRMFCCEQAWRHGLVQAALDGVAKNLPGSKDWMAEFNDWEWFHDHGHHLETRFGLVVAVFCVADKTHLHSVAKMLNSMRRGSDLSQLASCQLCQMAVDAGMLGAVHRAYAEPYAPAELVSLCLWLATHQYDKFVASNMDTILQQDCPWNAECDFCSLILLLAPSMDNDRKTKVALLLSNHRVGGVYNFGLTYGAWLIRTRRIPDVMAVCVEHNDLARKVLLDTWLPRTVMYVAECGGQDKPAQTAASQEWIDYVRCVHDVLVKVQLGSQAGDKAALPSLEKFYFFGRFVPVTVGTKRYLTNLEKIYERLDSMPDQPDQPDQHPTKRTCIATPGSQHE